MKRLISRIMYWSILFFYIHYYWEFNHIKQVLLCLKLCFYESLLSGSYSNTTVSGVALQIRLHGNMKCIMSSLKVFLAYLKCLQIIWGDRNIFNCSNWAKVWNPLNYSSVAISQFQQSFRLLYSGVLLPSSASTVHTQYTGQMSV